MNFIHIGVGSDVVCSYNNGHTRASDGGMDNRRFHAFFMSWPVLAGCHKDSDMDALNNASIQEPQPSLGFTSFAFPKAKSSQTGVSVEYAPAVDKKWFVLRTLFGHTQQVADMIIESGDYVYLAMIWRDGWRDGKKYRMLKPMMNLVFAYITPEQAEHYVKESFESRFVTFYYDHFNINSLGFNPPLTVSSKSMELLVRTTALQDEHVMQVDYSKCRFMSDDIVRVTYGPFEGVEGRVARVSRQTRVVVYIEGLNAGITTAYIPRHYLEKVNQ